MRCWRFAAWLTLALCNSASLSQAQVPPTPPARSVSDTDPARAFGGVAKLTQLALERMAAANATPILRGSGPYPAKLEVDLAFPDATIYRPADLDSLGSKKLGLIVWGNGGCTDDGASAAAHLAELASHGYVAVAPGKPLTGPAAGPGARSPAIMATSVPDLRDLLDWVLAENSRKGSPFDNRIDPRKIAVSGTSCGGMQAIILAQDPRVRAVVIHNSGIFPIIPDLVPLVIHPERVNGLHTPVLFVVGGTFELACPYTMTDNKGV
jgi:acetyl esterase/lipase